VGIIRCRRKSGQAVYGELNDGTVCVHSPERPCWGDRRFMPQVIIQQCIRRVIKRAEVPLREGGALGKPLAAKTVML
jgi:hypothetical protein